MIVEVKQYADDNAVSIGLDKYNRSKLPGTFEILQPAKGYDGRWLTGIDEDALEINSIRDTDTREKLKAETLKTRLDLQSLLGVDLSATNNEYWSKYKVKLADTVSLDLTNPRKKIDYYVLIANRYAAPEFGVLSNPEYQRSKYYVSRKEEETRERVITAKVKDEARAKLLELSTNYDKMVLIARYLLGARRIKHGMDEGAIYEDLSNFINDPKEKNNVSKFTQAVSKSVEELQYKLTLDEAIRMNIVKVTAQYVQRGNATYGKNLKEAIEYLSEIGNAAEFASLKEEVENQ